jgi:chemotaxis-related protein WspB
MMLLSFTAGANRYAVEIKRVVELIPKVTLRLVPHAPPFLAGLLGYRGKVIPVIDLSSLLGAAPCRDCLNTRIILVDDTPDHQGVADSGWGDSCGGTPAAERARDPNRMLLGLVAERVSDLTQVHREQLVTSPLQMREAPYLGAIVQTDDGIIQLITVERIRNATLGSSELPSEL